MKSEPSVLSLCILSSGTTLVVKILLPADDDFCSNGDKAEDVIHINIS